MRKNIHYFAVAGFLFYVMSASAAFGQGKAGEAGKGQEAQAPVPAVSETGPIGVGGEMTTDLLIKRIHKFLENLAPGMAATAEDSCFIVDGEVEKIVQVPLKAGVCYRMASTGDPKVKAIQFSVAVGNQKKIEGKKYQQFVIADLCPKKAGKAKIKIRAEGKGSVAFSTFAGSPEAILFTSGGKAFSLDGLLSRLDGARKKFGVKMKAAGTPTTGMLQYGKTKKLFVKLDKDFCYKFIAVSSCDENCGLKLSVLEGDKTLAQHTASSHESVIEFCPGKTFTACASIKLTSTDRGKEAFAFIPMRKKAKSKLKIYAAGEAKKNYIAKKIIGKANEVLMGQSAVSPVFTKKLKSNETVTYEVNLVGEVCYAIVAVGKPSVKDIKVTLINPIGQEIARDEQTGPEAVFVTKKCPQWDGKYKVKVKMFLGYGEVGMQVFGDVNE